MQGSQQLGAARHHGRIGAAALGAHKGQAAVVQAVGELVDVAAFVRCGSRFGFDVAGLGRRCTGAVGNALSRHFAVITVAQNQAALEVRRLGFVLGQLFNRGVVQKDQLLAAALEFEIGGVLAVQALAQVGAHRQWARRLERLGQAQRQVGQAVQHLDRVRAELADDAGLAFLQGHRRAGEVVRAEGVKQPLAGLVHEGHTAAADGVELVVVGLAHDMGGERRLQLELEALAQQRRALRPRRERGGRVLGAFVLPQHHAAVGQEAVHGALDARLDLQLAVGVGQQGHAGPAGVGWHGDGLAAQAATQPFEPGLEGGIARGGKVQCVGHLGHRAGLERQVKTALVTRLQRQRALGRHLGHMGLCRIGGGLHKKAAHQRIPGAVFDPDAQARGVGRRLDKVALCHGRLEVDCRLELVVFKAGCWRRLDEGDGH